MQKRGVQEDLSELITKHRHRTKKSYYSQV